MVLLFLTESGELVARSNATRRAGTEVLLGKHGLYLNIGRLCVLRSSHSFLFFVFVIRFVIRFRYSFSFFSLFVLVIRSRFSFSLFVLCLVFPAIRFMVFVIRYSLSLFLFVLVICFVVSFSDS